MAKEHKSVPLWILKNSLEKDFDKWCKERHSEHSSRNMIEFMLQNGFLIGKKWLDYIDTIDYDFRQVLEGQHLHCLYMEGFYPQNIYIGPMKK